MCKIDGQWEAAVEHRELSSVLCDDLERWDGSGVGGRLKRKGPCVYIWLIYVAVQQKLRHNCKASIFQ